MSIQTTGNINETAKVQQVSKASSDELLKKFAEADSDSDTDSAAAARKAARVAKRRKLRRRSAEGESCDGAGGGGLVERRSLLAPGTGRPRSAVLRRLGISRARDVKNRSVLGSIQKTWSKAVRGASRVFIEKHYNSHKRLITDMA